MSNRPPEIPEDVERPSMASSSIPETRSVRDEPLSTRVLSRLDSMESSLQAAQDAHAREMISLGTQVEALAERLQGSEAEVKASNGRMVNILEGLNSAESQFDSIVSEIERLRSQPRDSTGTDRSVEARLIALEETVAELAEKHEQRSKDEEDRQELAFDAEREHAERFEGLEDSHKKLREESISCYNLLATQVKGDHDCLAALRETVEDHDTRMANERQAAQETRDKLADQLATMKTEISEGLSVLTARVSEQRLRMDEQAKALEKLTADVDLLSRFQRSVKDTFANYGEKLGREIADMDKAARR